jgi:hypothetical protein
MVAICLIVEGFGVMEQTSASGMTLVDLCSFWAFVYANSLAPIGKESHPTIFIFVLTLQRLD